MPNREIKDIHLYTPPLLNVNVKLFCDWLICFHHFLVRVKCMRNPYKNERTA